MKYTVLFIIPDNGLFNAPVDYTDRFARDGIRLVWASPKDEIDDLARLAPQADGLLVGAGRCPIGDEILDQLPKCRIIVRMGAGYDNIDVDSATRHGVVASNMPGNLPEEVADHTVALFLACLRRLPQQDRALRAGIWDPALAAPADRLQGQTFGFVGFGRIARRVAEKMVGFGLHYIAHDPYTDHSEITSYGAEHVGFEELLRRSDTVSLHMPATHETRNLFDKRAFDLMKPSAILINTARGVQVNEIDLYNALVEGNIRCAGLDVFQDEPISPASPLLKLDNILMTPHVAGYSIEGLEDFFEFGHRLLADFFLEGRLPEWTLNPEVEAV
jgi:D-3-phosphoglycerate dehydrogenase